MTSRKRPLADLKNLSDEFKSTDYKDDGKSLDASNVLRTTSTDMLVHFLNQKTQITSLVLHDVKLSYSALTAFQLLLHIKTISLKDCTGLTIQTVNQFSTHCPLTHLDVVNCDLVDRKVALRLNQSIVTLDLSGNDLGHQRFPTLTNLTYLAIEPTNLNFSFLDGISSCTDLRTLKLHTYGETNTLAFRYLSALTRLKTLHMTGYQSEDNIEELNLMTSLTNLKLKSVASLAPLTGNKNLFSLSAQGAYRCNPEIFYAQNKKCQRATRRNAYREDLWLLHMTITLLMGRRYSPKSPFHVIPEEILLIILVYLADKTLRSEQQIERMFNLTRSNISRRNTHGHSFWNPRFVAPVKEDGQEKEKTITVFRPWQPW